MHMYYKTYIVALTPVEYVGPLGHKDPEYVIVTPVLLFTTLNSKLDHLAYQIFQPGWKFYM